jgi:hypothetical protein
MSYFLILGLLTFLKYLIKKLKRIRKKRVKIVPCL